MGRRRKQAVHLSNVRHLRLAYNGQGTENGVDSTSATCVSSHDPDHATTRPSTDDCRPSSSASGTCSDNSSVTAPSKPTASQRKLGFTPTDDIDLDSNTKGNLIISSSQLDSLISLFPCPNCMSPGSVHKILVKTMGLASCFKFECTACEETVSTWWTSEQKDQHHTVNKQSVLSSLTCGMGAHKLNNFCESMGLSGMHHKTFQTHASALYSQNDKTRQHIFERSAAIVREEHTKMDDATVGPTDTLDIAVSFDGSWLTRGHTSSVGIGCVIDMLTGLVVDAHIMSSYCQVCERWQKVKDTNPEAYAAWEHDHVGSVNCHNNFTGSSGMMEVHAARILWLRSQRRFNLRYTTFLSDGDSKAFNEVCSLKPYGPDVTIRKEECINHVSKRLGTALRSVVSDASKKKVTLGGRGWGRLTGSAIDKLTLYYGRALRGHTTADNMKNAVMASLYHCYSTDEDPQHQFCPTGKESWCFYNQALASDAEPGPHKTFLKTPLDKDRLEKYLQPVYERLTHPDLLRRCELKGTQNTNESLHSVIWSRCPKDHFYSKPRVEFALLTGIAEFNFGPAFSTQIRTLHGLETSPQGYKLMLQRIRRRLSNSEKARKDKLTKRRLYVKQAKRKRQEQLEKAEGGPAYGAGRF